jgi:serpin B
MINRAPATLSREDDMSHHKRFLPAALVLAMATAASPVSAKNAQEQVVRANNAFATDIYKQLSSQDRKNLFLSPLSIHTALAMTFLGSRGNTAREMATVLHLEMNQDSLLEGYDALLTRIRFDPKVLDRESAESAQPAMENGEVVCRADLPSQLRMANALWAERRYPFEAKYMERVQRHFRARLDTLDFGRRPDPARDVINRWVERQTCDRIKDLIPPGLIDGFTRLILANAIYFKDKWEDVFWDRATKDRPFYLPEGKTVSVPQMQQTGDFDYAETDGLQLLGLPYRDREVEMVVVLPRANNGLAGLEKRFTAENLDRWLTKLHRREVEVTLPKWTFERGVMLKDVLRTMGITQAFAWPGADFTGMSSTGGLYISQVVHKAFVAVDENGTEAAAATVEDMKAGAVAVESLKPKPVIFTADHPFVFLIRHRASGAILFLGRVANPKPESP